MSKGTQQKIILSPQIVAILQKFVDEWFKTLDYLAVLSLVLFVYIRTKSLFLEGLSYFSTLLLIYSITKKVEPLMLSFLKKIGWKDIGKIKFGIIYLICFIFLNFILTQLLMKVLFGMFEQWR